MLTPGKQTRSTTFAKGVLTTVEELEMLCQNHEFVHMQALMLRERILGPDHIKVQTGLLFRGWVYKLYGEYRRCIDLWVYAYKLQNARVKQFTKRSPSRIYEAPLFKLSLVFWDAYRDYHQINSWDNSFRVKFEEVLEVLNMATSNVDDATGMVISEDFQNDEYGQLVFMKLILNLIKLITELDNNNKDKLVSFQKMIYRLVRIQLKTQKGQTLLHLSVDQSTSEIEEVFFSQFPSIAVVELLLECGANVNAVDGENNTALHLCSKALQNPEMTQHHDFITRIAVLLLTHGAHADMVNHSGDRAIQGLTSNLMGMNTQDFVNLKCLAARVVMKYGIPYVGHIPNSLESFVQMHGTCAAKK